MWVSVANMMWRTEVANRCLKCVHGCILCFYTAHFSWVPFSAFISVSHDETVYQCKIHVMFKLFPNVSNMLEQICIFKLSVIQGLTVLFILVFPTMHIASIQ